MPEHERIPASDLPPDAAVVRGGEMKRKHLARAAQRYNLLTGNRGEYAISVWCLPGRSGSYIAAYSTEAAGLSYTSFRESTLGQIREAGYKMTQTGRPGHYTLRLPSPPTEADWQKIEDIFDDPKPVVEAQGGGD